jgi:UDP-N-acetylmuramoyl-tripeptide--D-alanyl-D-alanine ligase
VLELRQAFEWLGKGRLLAADPGDTAPTLTGVSTDTRAVRPGELFVALRGDRFDAHDFVGQALEAGAAALMIERWTPGCRVPALWVDDSRRGLGEIATGWRRRFELPVIAVAGSNGKTTVKEMIAAVLAAHLGEAARLATRGNLNNDVGVPLTVLRLGAHHRAAVIELGMNRPGEIAWLAAIAQAGVALVNNAQREHQEFLHSVEATARENGAAIAALPPDGVAVYPGDDPHAPLWRALAGARRRLEFGLTPQCAVHAEPGARPEGFTLHIEGTALAVAIAIDGTHNVRNALAAAACCHAIGVPPATIARGLADFRPAAGRLRRLRSTAGAALIDDTYNANPDSVRAAIDVLAGHGGVRVLVLGDMGEVGDQGPQFHAEVGAYARSRGIERLIAFGAASAGTVRAFGEGAEHAATIEAACDRASALAVPGATVLVKGSRSMRMERVVQALAGTAASDGGHA